MSALEFKPAAEQFSDNCLMEECNRRGRYSILVCGYPVPSKSPYAMKNARAVICGPCRKKWREMWEGASEEVPERAVEQAFGAIAGSPSERFEAICWLRSVGFSKDVLATRIASVPRERKAVAA